jgi:hypothetical protein
VNVKAQNAVRRNKVRMPDTPDGSSPAHARVSLSVDEGSEGTTNGPLGMTERVTRAAAQEK